MQERIAVVGTGLAGLVTAYLLHHDAQKRYAVEIFEIGHVPSLDSASVSVPNKSTGGEERIDVPMRAFTGGYYPSLKRMYDYLGIKYREQPFIFHFTRLEPRRSAQYFVHASNNHEFPPKKPVSMTTLAWLCELLIVCISYLWFSICCLFIPVKPMAATSSGETLGEYLSRLHVPTRFVSSYLLPLMSAVTTCSHQSLLDSPASDVVNYKRLITLGKQYVVSDGVGTVQKKLTVGLDIKYNREVTAVDPDGDAVKLSWKSSQTSQSLQSEEKFDRVIFAVPPDVVAKIFLPLRRALSLVPVTAVDTVVHTDFDLTPEFEQQTDERQLQDCSRLMAGVAQAQHIHLGTELEKGGRTEAIHRHDSGVLVTSCPITPINPSQVIRATRFTRVLRTPKSSQITRDIFEPGVSLLPDEKMPAWKNGKDGVWLVGSWCWDGMVLLEGCVVSAMRVARALNVEVPWQST